MTQADHDGGRQTPSWYSSPDEPPPAHNHQSGPSYRQPPTADETGAAGVGGCGVPGPGDAPTGYSYSSGPQQSWGYFGYSPTPGTDELNRMHSIEADQAQSAATVALVLSIIGFFTMPFILGPLAIWQASKARRLGHAATVSWVLGWVCTLWGVAAIAMPILFFLLVAFLAGA